jgi:pilus assembly protein CpaC
VKAFRTLRKAAPAACLAVIAALLLTTSAAAPAPAPATVQPDAVQAVPRIQLTVGKSIVLKTKYSIGKASVADDKIADIAAPMLPGQNKTSQVYVAGKAPGLTTLTLWDETDQIKNVYDIEVAPDLTRLKKMIYAVMPEETGIEVHNNNDAIALSGQVKSATNLQKALSLAESYAPGKVINLLTVGGVNQVMLEVRVAEMNRTLLKNLGVNINALTQGNFVYTMLGGLTNVPLLNNVLTNYRNTTDTSNQVNGLSRFDPQRSPLNITSNVNAMANVNTNINGQSVTWTGLLNLLKENDLVKILAEPTLVCLNGQTAEFLAGGEVPVPIPQALGTITIEWKKFGVELAFTPTVLSGNRISLKVSPSVSDLDYTHSVTVGGYQIPSINIRSTSTVIEMDDGQSFAIAGLLQEELRNSSQKYPALGDVPVLGSLFKSAAYQKDTTELVVIITPRLAKPMDKSITKLPTDGVHEPTDLEFYLNMPQKSGTEKPKDAAVKSAPAAPAGKSGLDGDFGQAVPDMTQSSGR